MAVTHEFEQFYVRWIAKANRYTMNTLGDCFDKFFTLFVTYNRLYVSATFLLRQRDPAMAKKWTSFPDGKAATDYVLQYISSSEFMKKIEENQEVVNAIVRIMDLIQRERFYIKLDMVTGDRQRNKDLELLKALGSRSRNTRAKAILQVLYNIRCNMFHAHKALHPVQMDLLRPAIVVLQEVVRMLHDKMASENNYL